MPTNHADWQSIAEFVTYQSFANGYWREIDPGRLVLHAAAPGAAVQCVEWALPSQRMVVRSEIVARSLCGPSRFGRLWMRAQAEIVWQPVAPFTALFALVRESCGRLPSRDAGAARDAELDLLSRVLQSYQAVRARLERDAAGGETDGEAAETFLAAEQSLAFGHWLHPTPKSLHGITHWQAPTYAPDGGGWFRLRLFAVPAGQVRHNSALAQSAPRMIAATLGADLERLGLRNGELAIPMHPLQAEALLLDPAVRALVEAGVVRPLGEAGPAFTATASVRTVYSPHSPWMFKFSLPVRITNSERRNQRHELEAGVLMARLVAAIAPGLPPELGFLRDPAYITLDPPDGRGESGFEVILRDNPFRDGAGAGVVMVAALTADPLPGRTSLLARVVGRTAVALGLAPAAAAQTWFACYLDRALTPLVRLYDAHGIALEAHQQNSLLEIGGGLPGRFLYRDNQGFYLSETHRDRLRRLVPESEHTDGLYFPDAEIARRMAYYVVGNQVFSVIARLGKDGLAEESDLLAVLRRHLEVLRPTLAGVGRGLVAALLDRPTLTTKLNLTVGLRGIDELRTPDGRALYADGPNPLCPPGAVPGDAVWRGHEAIERRRHAVAP